jgi:hypothetical protein
MNCCCCSGDQTDGSGIGLEPAPRPAASNWFIVRGGVLIDLGLGLGDGDGDGVNRFGVGMLLLLDSSPRKFREMLGKGGSSFYVGKGGEIYFVDKPSCMYAGASSPRAEVVSFASLSVPLLRMALRRASARAAADIVVEKVRPVKACSECWTWQRSQCRHYCLSPMPEYNIQKAIITL